MMSSATQAVYKSALQAKCTGRDRPTGGRLAAFGLLGILGHAVGHTIQMGQWPMEIASLGREQDKIYVFSSSNSFSLL